MRTAELFLQHRLFRSLDTGEVIRRDWLTLHYPPYCDALAILVRRRRPDGRWQPGAYWWKPPGTPRGTVEVVDWGRSAPSQMIMLNALRIIRSIADNCAQSGGSY